MADVFDPLPQNSTPKPSTRDLEYGTIESSASSDRNDSAVIVSPTEQPQPRPGYSRPHQHRIIPPSIKGHGRLIVAHRTVPYWVGVAIVLGAFAWAVWCALYVYPLFGGHAHNWQSD
ncbi:hypothetical protein BKA66DRAFT_570715 [Pyrenochaeta sp. MPI-SDFR-AT-0127]|nr:hypothetical protein BKA66DRAFT_570715 [Pyrenochaeta sp. MPI-SDFR-AT-0127]